MSSHRNPLPGGAARFGAMSTVEWVLVFALAAIWGASFFFGKVLLAVMEPITIVGARAGIAALALIALLRLTGGTFAFTGTAWRTFAVMSLFNNIIPFVLILWGQKQIGSGLAAILNATTPFFAAVFAHGVGIERLTGHRIAGVAIGLAGVVVMIGPDVLVEGLGGSVLAQLAVLGAAISYAIAIVLGRRLTTLGIPAHAAAAGQLTVTTLIVLPFSLLIDQPWNGPSLALEHWASLLALALVSTALGYIIFFRLLSGAGAVNASLVTLLVPVSALLLGTLVLHEVFTLRQATGMAVILLGLVVTDGRMARYALRRARGGG